MEKVIEMKIGIFTNAYHPLVSGVVNAIDCVEQGLSRLGHQVFVIAPEYPSYQDSGNTVIRFPSVRLTSRADFPIPIPYIPRLTRYIEDLRLDIVHAQHPFLLGVLGQRIAKKKKIPLVFTFHTLYEQYVHYAPPLLPRPFLRYYVRKMVSSFVRQCDAVVVPSPSILELVHRYGGDGRSIVIPNAIQLKTFQKADGTSIEKKYGLTGKKTMIFVGRLAEEKNLSFLLKAHAKIISRIPDAVLMLVGDGPFKTSLQEQAQHLKIEQNVIFTGMVPYPQIPSFFKSSQLFVITSTTEVKPLAILEAMASGLPVLAVKASGAVDTITDEVDGYLTRHDEDEFAAAAILLLTNEKKRALLSRNALKTAESFDSSAMARKLERLYMRLKHEQSSKEQR